MRHSSHVMKLMKRTKPTTLTTEATTAVDKWPSLPLAALLVGVLHGSSSSVRLTQSHTNSSIWL